MNSERERAIQDPSIGRLEPALDPPQAALEGDRHRLAGIPGDHRRPNVGAATAAEIPSPGGTPLSTNEPSAAVVVRSRALTSGLSQTKSVIVRLMQARRDLDSGNRPAVLVVEPSPGVADDQELDLDIRRDVLRPLARSGPADAAVPGAGEQSQGPAVPRRRDEV